MSGQRPTFWSTLGLELKGRLCAAGALLAALLLSAALNAMGQPIPEAVAHIGLILVIYVIGAELIGGLIANISGVRGLSLIASAIDYGLVHFAILRWMAGLTIVGILAYGLFLSPDAPPWFGK